MSNNDVLIRASFGKYDGKPTGILAMVMDVNGTPMLLFTNDETPAKFEPQTGFIFITDMPGLDSIMVFEQTQFIQAIEAYRELKAKGILVIEPSLRKYDISDNVQIDGLKDSGRFNYQVQGVTNGAAAILATALYFKQHCRNERLVASTAVLMNMLTTIQ